MVTFKPLTKEWLRYPFFFLKADYLLTWKFQLFICAHVLLVQYKKGCGFHNIFQNFTKNKKNRLKTNLWNFDPLWTFPGITWGPTQNFGPIGSAVLTLIGFKTDTQTDKQSIYRRCCRGNTWLSELNALKICLLVTWIKV